MSDKPEIIRYLHATKGWKLGSPATGIKRLVRCEWSDGTVTKGDEYGERH